MIFYFNVALFCVSRRRQSVDDVPIEFVQEAVQNAPSTAREIAVRYIAKRIFVWRNELNVFYFAEPILPAFVSLFCDNYGRDIGTQFWERVKECVRLIFRQKVRFLRNIPMFHRRKFVRGMYQMERAIEASPHLFFAFDVDVSYTQCICFGKTFSADIPLLFCESPVRRNLKLVCSEKRENRDDAEYDDDVESESRKAFFNRIMANRKKCEIRTVSLLRTEYQFNEFFLCWLHRIITDETKKTSVKSVRLRCRQPSAAVLQLLQLPNSALSRLSCEINFFGDMYLLCLVAASGLAHFALRDCKLPLLGREMQSLLHAFFKNDSLRSIVLCEQEECRTDDSLFPLYEIVAMNNYFHSDDFIHLCSEMCGRDVPCYALLEIARFLYPRSLQTPFAAEIDKKMHRFVIQRIEKVYASCRRLRN